MNTRYSDNRPLPVRILSILGKVLILGTASIFTAFPFIWMMVSALKTKADILNTDIFFPTVPQWSNITSIIFDSPIPRYIFNSAWVSTVIVALQIVSGAMLAYALVFLKFRTNKFLFAIVMATYMLPVAATYIPSYIILADWKMLDTFRGLIISSTVSIFGIFLLRQAFMQIPKGLVEAARMDGASHWRALWEVVCPMTKASFITFGLMNFISTYNNYMWPSLITKSSEYFLVSQGLRAFFIRDGAYGTEWALVMAASAVVVIPLLVLFAFTQKWFINGIGGETGIKG
ncbi:MAG: carbohydrate ABC transporter permease [Erysipelotrichaceae bacterium]|jgi:multiple sugar transport system permease protein|nr:carbohydrate ABC transporter permease [Erysipelotrichaceae bacterium]MBQ1810134.1 carbohydrate ABC transporter permease [Erysipelotrichaceae bacterium]MBR3150912.1 carbohydrate ABC transporter permease [Erysipelotrichaceae bacterium]MBR3167218.1 carbohydrate ABC transporter permease [Erysipelotrichaceae bacterium]MCR5300537.1 carbohydrate ABC transporter permease [Erysipelotrichaceae bacterium]